MSLGKTYLDSVIKKMTAYKVLGDKTFEQLEEKDFHYSPNEESNSIAIIVQHLSGNMLSRWKNFLTEDGEKEWRQRDDEFEVHKLSKQQIIDIWNKGWQSMFTALQSLTDEDLMKTITIRNEPMPAVDAINRQLAHYPYNVGQIVYIGKILKNHDWKNLSVPKKKT
jgi:hypothetical protein